MDKPTLAAIISVSGTTLSDTEKNLLEKYNPLGVTLFNRNLQSAEQTKSLIDNIKETIGHDDVVIAVDQEGGRVNRLKAAGFPEYTYQKILGDIDDTALTALHCRLMAQDMLSVGINFNYAPSLDIEYPQTTPALLGRCFGTDKDLIIKHGQIVIETYMAQGICPCIKHMPGHGRAAQDPHLNLPVITSPLASLTADFAPFAALKTCPAGMTAHLLIPEIDDKRPITLSKKGIAELIRGQIGFDGLLITDSIDMHALHGSVIDKAAAAWDAGCDVVCYCHGQADELIQLCQNGRCLSEKAQERFNKVKNVLQNKKKSRKLINERIKYDAAIRHYSEYKINYDATEVLHQMQKGE